MFLLTLQSLHFSEIMATGSLHVFSVLRFLRLNSITILLKDFFAKTVYDIRFDFRWKFFTISVFTTDYYSIFYR